jgi:hypothetical protein
MEKVEVTLLKIVQSPDEFIQIIIFGDDQLEYHFRVMKGCSIS